MCNGDSPPLSPGVQMFNLQRPYRVKFSQATILIQNLTAAEVKGPSGKHRPRSCTAYLDDCWQPPVGSPGFAHRNLGERYPATICAGDTKTAYCKADLLTLAVPVVSGNSTLTVHFFAPPL